MKMVPFYELTKVLVYLTNEQIENMYMKHLVVIASFFTFGSKT